MTDLVTLKNEEWSTLAPSKKRESKIADVANKHVGAKLREQRIMADLTQEGLATQLGISYQQIQKYEVGTNRISAGRLHEIARIFSIDIASFFEGLTSGASKEKAPYGNTSSPAVNVARNFSGIEDQNIRSCVSDLVRAIAAMDD